MLSNGQLRICFMSLPSLSLKDHRAMFYNFEARSDIWEIFKIISSIYFSSRQADADVLLGQRAAGIFQSQGQKASSAQRKEVRLDGLTRVFSLSFPFLTISLQAGENAENFLWRMRSWKEMCECGLSQSEHQRQDCPGLCHEVFLPLRYQLDEFLKTQMERQN